MRLMLRRKIYVFSVFYSDDIDKNVLKNKEIARNNAITSKMILGYFGITTPQSASSGTERNLKVERNSGSGWKRRNIAACYAV